MLKPVKPKQQATASASQSDLKRGALRRGASLGRESEEDSSHLSSRAIAWGGPLFG